MDLTVSIPDDALTALHQARRKLSFEQARDVELKEVIGLLVLEVANNMTTPVAINAPIRRRRGPNKKKNVEVTTNNTEEATGTEGAS